MTDYTIKRLGLILAIQAEIEGMKAENLKRQSYRSTPKYTENDFDDMAFKLRDTACKPDELL